MELTFLTRSECSSCERAEEIIDRLAAEYSIPVSKLPLDSEPGRALAEEWAAMFPPVVLIDGGLFSQARLSEEDLRKELEKRRANPA